jgi:hypothetical protein
MSCGANERNFVFRVVLKFLSAETMKSTIFWDVMVVALTRF